VLLISQAGGGKHMLIDKLAFESYNGHVPPNPQHKRVLALMTGSLLAGMSEQSELQTRLELVLGELTHAEVIIAIPEIQDILGSSTFNIDLSGSLLPYLEHGVVPIVATTTPENYKKYVEHSSLRDVFTPIVIKQPDTETLFGMLFMAVKSLEEKQRYYFSYTAILKAAQLAMRFDTTGALPGSAVKLLEATGTALLVKGKSVITDDDVTSHVEETTHVPVAEPKEEEKQLLINLETVLHQKVIGQQIAISAISQGMRRLREGLSSTTKPVSFLFLGPTGVGKTETAKALADVYYHGQGNMLRFDMSEYSGPDGLRRLLGSAPGEGDEKGELTEKVFDNPSSLILLDEFEKANPTIHDLFLQVLDDGRLTDNKGKTVSFTNSIIIATSNAGSEFIREHISAGKNVDKTFQQQLLTVLQQNHLFKPELLNRFDDVVIFEPLNHEQVITITTLLLQALTKKLAEQDITVTFTPEVIEKVANDSFDAEMGARPIQRHIQDTLEDIIAKKKLDGTLVRGSKATFILDQSGNITLH
jgi:ATP-dependent Clp protease ATP-binding subunit ClpC